jgi:hypothetical protein
MRTPSRITRTRFHGGRRRVRRAALVHEGTRGRAGLLQLAQDAAADRWPRQLRASPPGPGGGLLRDLGVVTFKIDDDVFKTGPQTAVRVAGNAFRSVHNDADGEAELLIFSPRLDKPPTEKKDDFWASA